MLWGGGWREHKPVDKSCIPLAAVVAIRGTSTASTGEGTAEFPVRMFAAVASAHSRIDSMCVRANCDSRRRSRCAHCCTHGHLHDDEIDMIYHDSEWIK